MTREEKLNRSKTLCYYNKGTQLTVCAIKTGKIDNMATFEIKATVCFNIVFLKNIYVNLTSCDIEEVVKRINAILKILYNEYFSPESLAKRKNEAKEHLNKRRKNYYIANRDIMIKRSKEYSYKTGYHDKYLKKRLNYRDNLELTFFDELDYRREEALIDVYQKYDAILQHAKLYI